MTLSNLLLNTFLARMMPFHALPLCLLSSSCVRIEYAFLLPPFCRFPPYTPGQESSRNTSSPSFATPPQPTDTSPDASLSSEGIKLPSPMTPPPKHSWSR